MTHTLFLMRHAKAESHRPVSDFDRELAPAGILQARQAGLQLAGRGIQLVLSSSSMRTRQTYEALRLRTPSGDSVPVEFMDALYLGSADAIRQRISEITEDVTSLLVIAHSPGIPSLAAELAWTSAPHEADQISCWFPTSAYSEFSLDTSWANIADYGQGAQLTDVTRPAKDR
ncbi:histidine phosphatase family protein [Propionimicrobium sp. PCR01-08-3]|uniref:SixA phosphatase family protein n=1 Tax=Propionimicrobium sp. PCR01-08-3 TaxID=3052086 RepID=UPI00255CEE7A|nr:histidine phosphatase family protein [Propionimicrobium sp. PCR01-08-3]WIY82069.1 histidine phosphatase family protein [Propionimicrobium sp. PCR01-08-3]